MSQEIPHMSMQLQFFPELGEYIKAIISGFWQTNLEKVDRWESLADLLHQLQHLPVILFITEQHH